MENSENLRFFMDESSAPYNEHVIAIEDNDFLNDLVKEIEKSD